MNPRVAPILQQMADYRRRFEAFARSLSPEELAAPVPDSPWTACDYVAHLCTVDSLINARFGSLVGIQAPPPDVPPPVPFDIDDWNHAMVAARRGRSVEALLAEGAEHRARYVACLEAITEAHLDLQVPYGGDRKVIDLPAVPVQMERIIWAIALHDPRHVQDILRALPHRGDDPTVKEWLDGVDFSIVDPAIAARRV